MDEVEDFIKLLQAISIDIPYKIIDLQTSVKKDSKIIDLEKYLASLVKTKEKVLEELKEQLLNQSIRGSRGQLEISK